jgi:hypothetical protein
VCSRGVWRQRNTCPSASIGSSTWPASCRHPQPDPTVHACALSYGHSPRLLRRAEWKTACVIARIRHWCLGAQADNRRRRQACGSLDERILTAVHSSSALDCIALTSPPQAARLRTSQPHHGYSHDARGPRPTALPMCVRVCTGTRSMSVIRPSSAGAWVTQGAWAWATAAAQGTREILPCSGFPRMQRRKQAASPSRGQSRQTAT